MKDAQTMDATTAHRNMELLKDGRLISANDQRWTARYIEYLERSNSQKDQYIAGLKAGIASDATDINEMIKDQRRAIIEECIQVAMTAEPRIGYPEGDQGFIELVSDVTRVGIQSGLKKLLGDGDLNENTRVVLAGLRKLTGTRVTLHDAQQLIAYLDDHKIQLVAAEEGKTNVVPFHNPE